MDEDNIEVDMMELERQRYQEILDSDKFMELKILVGEPTQSEKDPDSQHTIPCVRIEGAHVQPQMVAVLYSSLEEVKSILEKEYPAECFAARLTLSSTNLGVFGISDDKKKKGRKKKKE